MKKYFYNHPYIFAVIFYALINLVAGYGVTLFVDIKAVYENLNTPSWAPATWVFGVVWTINNILVLLGSVWTFKSRESKTRTTLIKLQIASWINYAVFQWLSFGTGVPAMFFWPTLSMLLLTIASVFYAYRLDQERGGLVLNIKRFRSITLSFSTLLVWLIIASTLGFYIMTNN